MTAAGILCEHDRTCQSETVKGGEVTAVRNTVRWVARPVARENGWHRAALAINGVLYGAGATYQTDGDSGLTFLVVDLAKVGGRTHRVCLEVQGDGGECDCEHATYRGCVCKHVAAVRAALTWLEERERLEWDVAVAEAAVNDLPHERPF